MDVLLIKSAVTNKAKGQIAILESLFCSFMYSVKVVLVSAVAASLGGFTLAWTSTAVGGALLGIYVFVIKKSYLPLRLPVKVWLYLILVGILWSLTPVFQFMALERISSTTLNFLFNFVGVATILFSIIINKEKPTRYQFVGTAIMIIGLEVFFQKKPTMDEFTGVFFVVLSIFCTGIMNALARELNKLVDNWAKANPAVNLTNLSVNAASKLLGAAVLLSVGLIVDLPLPVFTSMDFLVLSFSAIFGLAMISVFWYDLLGRWEAYKASLLSSVSVFWTMLLSAIFLHQAVTWFQIGGVVIMFVGLALILFSYRKSDTAPSIVE